MIVLDVVVFLLVLTLTIVGISLRKNFLKLYSEVQSLRKVVELQSRLNEQKEISESMNQKEVGRPSEVLEAELRSPVGDEGGVIYCPNIGEDTGAEVVKLDIVEGQDVVLGFTLLVVESDKAVIEIPSPYAGKVEDIYVSRGQKVREGDRIAKLVSAH